MYSGKIALTLLAVVALGNVYAKDLFELKSLSDFKNRRSITQNGENFTVKGKSRAITIKKVFDIDPTKTYSLSGEVRLVSGKAPRILLSLNPKTIGNKSINAANVRILKDSETALATEAKPGDTVLKIVNGKKWDVKKNAYNYIAFDVKENFTDLPNFTIQAIKKNSLKQIGNIWELTLNKPLTKGYPAGTAVRQHITGDPYITMTGTKRASENWEKRSGLISGISTYGNGDKQFWAGTKKAEIVLYFDGGDRETVIEFKDIEFEIED